MSRISNSEGLGSSEQTSTGSGGKPPLARFVTMRSDQAWKLLDDAKSQDPTRQGVLALALKEAAAIIIRASERSGVVGFPECIQTALEELAKEEAAHNQNKVVVLAQSQGIEPALTPDLPVSA